MKRTLEQIIEDELPKVDLTKKELAKLVGLSGSHFNNISKGKASTRKSGYRPDPEVVNKLALYLKVSVEEILEGQGYELTKTPPDLSGFIERYKTLEKPDRTKVHIILQTIMELISPENEATDSKGIVNQVGKAMINGQEVNVRILEPVEGLENLITKGKD